MLEILPSLDVLLHSPASAWTRSLPSTGRSFWTHVQGMTLLVQRGRDQPRSWSLRGTCGFSSLHLMLPRTRRRGLMNDITPLLDDIQAWVLDTDLGPRTRIADQVAAWLMLHGHTGRYTCTMPGRPHAMVVRLRDSVDFPAFEALTVPAALMHRMQADIDAFWHRSPPPDIGYTTVSWRSARNRRSLARHLHIDVPTSQHARLHLLSQAGNGLLDIPWPDPRA